MRVQLGNTLLFKTLYNYAAQGSANRKFSFEANHESNQGVVYVFNADCHRSYEVP